MNTDDFTTLIFNNIQKTVNRAGLHPLDEDRIKGAFKALYADGKELNLVLLETLAKKNHWSDSATKFLVGKATQIANGGRVQLKYDKEIGATLYHRIINSNP